MENCTIHSGPSSFTDQSNPFASELFPSIVQCFSIILIGYLSAHFNLLSSNGARGIEKYITTFALPALFFQAMVTINFSDVQWFFLGAICLSKVIMFFSSVILVIISLRPVSLSMAGIIGIFTSQSNDIALGYPIIESLLPDQAHYIYLVAPAQLAFLNPIGFTMLEIQKQMDDRSQAAPAEVETPLVESEVTSEDVDNASVQTVQPSHRHLCKRCTESLVCRIFVRILLNPLVFMTLIGVPFNFILKQQIPEIINKALTVLAQSYAGTALFALGFNMLGKLGNLSRRSIYIVTVILLAKLVVSPFIMYQMVWLLSPLDGNATTPYTVFAFLYGQIPTAPPVFFFASQYHVAEDVIASGLVLGTFISFPWTYISARLVSVVVDMEMDYHSLLRDASFNIAICSIVCSVWVLVIFTLSRKIFRIPHMFTTAYLFSVLLACVGCLCNQEVMKIYNMHLDQPVNWYGYTTFSVFFVGVIGSRILMFVGSLVLVLLKLRGLCFILHYKWVFLVIGCGAPLVISMVLLLFVGNSLQDVDAIFIFGNSQLIASVSVLLVCLIGMIVCKIVHVRYGYSRAVAVPVPGETTIVHSAVDESSTSTALMEPTPGPASANHDFEGSISMDGTDSVDDRSTSDSYDAEYLTSWLNAHPCTLRQHQSSATGRELCRRNLIKYWKLTQNSLPENGEFKGIDKEYQTHQHTALFILAIISMFLGTLLCTWRLVHESPSGVYLMLEFLDVIFTFGQGFFLFALFGLDSDLILLPIKKIWRKLLYGTEKIHLPSEEELDADVILERQQFVNFFLAPCKRAIVGRKRYRLKIYDDVFRGDHFVSWLQRIGLAASTSDAVEYGRNLLNSRVIHHVTREHHFYNLGYFYRFSRDFENRQSEEVEFLRGTVSAPRDLPQPSQTGNERIPQVC